MGLFDKREKMDLNKLSGIVFIYSLITQGRMAQIEIEGIDKNHGDAVRCGYNFGLAITLLGSQIGSGNIDSFISLAIKNAYDTTLPEGQKNIPEQEKYIRKATSWILKESSKYGNNLFEEYAKAYLNDLYEGNEYSNNMLNIVIEDLRFYYENWKKIESGVKIVK